MLILARKINESIMIGDQIEVSVVDIRGEQVKLGIKAPARVKVYREEVYRAIQQENLEAAKARPETLPDLDRLLPGRQGREGSGNAAGRDESGGKRSRGAPEVDDRGDEESDRTGRG